MKNDDSNKLNRLGYVKRRSSSKAKVTVPEFEAYKSQFLYDVKAIMEMEEIPKELVINWDHTGIHYVPVSNWTVAKEGSKRIEIFGSDDKRQITAVFAATMSGDFLFPQIIYAGKTPRCLPSVKFPDGWHVMYTENHWANEHTTVDYINQILLPYVKRKRIELTLDANYPALVIFDRFKAQCTAKVLKMLEDNNIYIAIVPAITAQTDCNHWMSVSISQSRSTLGANFNSGTLIKCVLNWGKNSQQVLGAKWLIGVHEYIKSKQNIIINGFKEAGLYTD